MTKNEKLLLSVIRVVLKDKSVSLELKHKLKEKIGTIIIDLMEDIGLDDDSFFRNPSPFLGELCNNCHSYQSHACLQNEDDCVYENWEEAARGILRESR